MRLLFAVLLVVYAPKAYGQPPMTTGPGPCQRLGGVVVNDCAKCSTGTCIKDTNSTTPGVCCLTTLVDKNACLRLNGTTSCLGCDSTCVSLKDKSVCCLTRDGSTKCSMEKIVRMNLKNCSATLKPLTNSSTTIANGCRAISDVLGCLAKASVNTTDANVISTCIEDLTVELKGDPNAHVVFLSFLTTNNLTIGIPNFSYSLCQGIGSNATCTTTDLINALSADPATCMLPFSPLLSASNSIATGCGALKEGIECLTNASLKRTASSTSPMKCQTDVYAELRQGRAYNDLLDFMMQFNVQIAIPDFHFQACQENWNTSCAPGVMLPSTECTSDCTGTTPCPSGQECCTQKCSNGKETRKCAPDMRHCADINAISQRALDDCVTFFGNVISNSITFEAYCSNLWGGLKCVAEKMMVTRPRYTAECVTRMALYLRLNQTAITDGLKQLPMANIKQEYAMNSMRCSENPLITESIPSRPGNESACANPATVVGYFTSGACKPPANTDVNAKNCQAFDAMLECIANAFVKDMGMTNGTELQRRLCVDTMTQMMSHSNLTLKRLFGGNAGAFDPKKCFEQETVCGTENSRPLEGRTCSAREACPSGYKCVEKYCCPEERSGLCPDFSGKRPPCNARCHKDADCRSQEKCCNVGCNGGSTCVPLASHHFSQCEREFENAKQLLTLSGECGDGTSVLNIPKCENSRFAPTQGDLEKNRFYCVDEHGDKIPGSDHSDAVDCTKVNAGKCPDKPAVCANKAKPDIYQCHDDSTCAAKQKCCMTKLSDVCITGCVNITQADDTVKEDCPNPVCCPITLCQDQVCASDVTATCRIQSCGQCSVKFYNKDGLVKDCAAGVPKCQAQRIAARIANAKMKKTAGQKLVAFINGRLRQSNGSSAEMDDVMRTEGDVMEMEADLLDRLPEDPEMGMQHHVKDAPRVDQFCSLLNKFAPCQRGNCSLGDPSRSVWQLCTCEPGFYGLLCEKNDTDPAKTLSKNPCERERHNADAIRSLLRTATTSRLSAVVSMYVRMRGDDIRFIPEIACGGALEFNSTQRALLLPDRGVYISYCTNRTTGKPVPNTMVVAAESAATLTRPDCGITVQQDPFSLPERCLFSKRQNCTSSNCGYFYDLASQRCMKGAATVHSFGSLTDCYETCSFSYKCHYTNTPDVCALATSPKPCQDATGKSKCDYRKQFCHVSENADMSQMGTCKDFPAFCLLNASAGYSVMGVAKEPAYHYNATSRRCERFMYHGMGGNNNRFSSLHQCHTECGARAYKYDDVSCPLPSLLMTSYPEIQENVCDNDSGCPDGQVCCSNGMFHVCASPVKTCVGGGRCSLDGICDRGNCTCPECDTATSLPVCGSDGTTYHSLCALRQRACMSMANITVASYGACHREKCNGIQCKEYESCVDNACACSSICTMEYEPLCAVVPGRNIKRQFGNKCHLTSVACQTRTRFVVIRNGTCDFKSSVTCETVCPSDYDPVCVLYPGTSGTPVTLPNMCHVYKCSENDASTRPQVLYSGECQALIRIKCGAEVCPTYQQCVNGTCGCNSMCTKELRPVCAHASNVPDLLKTFSNECEMRREGCEKAVQYIIVKFGPCVKPAPKSDCPATRPDVPRSYSFSCRVDTDAFCDRETEKCCPYGAGTRCVPRSSLIVRKEIKSGFCPRLSPLTYHQSDCHSDLCGQDGDCAGTAKCCMNVVCGHSTCAVPELPRPESGQTTVCGAGFTEIPEVECDPSVSASSCPAGFSCKLARVGEETVGVCCSKMAADMANDPDIRARQALCRLLEVVGIGCPMGRKCMGDVRGGRVCGVEDQLNCSVGIVQCLVNPCNSNTCSNYPTAKCTANYCGGCHALYTMDGKDVTHLCNATRCQNERDFYEKLNKAGVMEMTAGLQEVNIFAGHMRMALHAQGVKTIPANGTIVCDSAGHYRPYQHYMDAKGKVHKLCVNTKTGAPYGRPDPERPCEEHDNASRPELCSEKPDMTSTCDDSETERYFYNPDSASCEMYMDRGCNVMAPNSFNDLVACTSVCGGYGRSSPCNVKQCATGTHCVVFNGSAMCKALGENNGSGHLEPVCDKEGKFMKRQCYQGVCACVDPETGSVTNTTDCNKDLPVAQGTNNVDLSSCSPGSSTKRVYCPNDGDGCNGCKIPMMSHSMEQCSKCQTCPTQRACGAHCKVTSVCKERPYAVCRINKCNCAEEFVENGKVVTNCEKAQSKCEMMKTAMGQQAKQSELRGEKASDVQYRCSKTGSFEVMCRAGSCHCLNATSGENVGPEIRGALESIDCTETQKKTKPSSVKVRLTVAKDKKLADFSAQARQEIIDGIKREMEKKAPGSKVTVVLRDGSIVADVTVESTGQSDVEGVDISSAAESFIAEANNNGIELTVGGVPFSTETGTASLTEIVVVENPVTERPTDASDDDEKKRRNNIIIIVVCVVGGSALIAIGVGIYCYKKANRSKDQPFSNIEGKSNPVYENEVPK